MNIKTDPTSRDDYPRPIIEVDDDPLDSDFTSVTVRFATGLTVTVRENAADLTKAVIEIGGSVSIATDCLDVGPARCHAAGGRMHIDYAGRVRLDVTTRA